MSVIGECKLAPAAIETADAVCSAFSQPNAVASTGVSAGEMKPPMLLPQFITPPAAPLFAPASSDIVAQNAPSAQRTKAVAKARLTAATYAFDVCAPIDKNVADRMKPAIGTMRRPCFKPRRFTSQSEAAPPAGMDTIDINHGKLLNNALRIRSK